MSTLNGVAVSTELLKIKGDVKKNPEDVKHSGSDHPQGISAPSFRTAPAVSGGGEVILNYSNIEAVLMKRQPGDTPRNTSMQAVCAAKTVSELHHMELLWENADLS